MAISTVARLLGKQTIWIRVEASECVEWLDANRRRLKMRGGGGGGSEEANLLF